ncbi:hypothetical protein BT93_E1873 [Corymbia citriodora subsp. variegata]|nr:hypothetical protein BT93_E1873 [Corymbia citriodora subsp. variegata]
MASSSKPKEIYDVFLSFRGTDVRNNFLGHLNKALDQNGIYTFIDSEELKKGDQISPALMEAIEESRIAIIVFSKGYASSWWCLEELAKIMECKGQKDLIVIPLFYKVDPSEVRGGRESYRRALAKQESKFGKDSAKMKRWKKALFDAGSLSGWHLNDGDESELINKIVKKISTKLHYPLRVAKHPVGIYSRVIELKSILNLESKDSVLMVGLWGQGGIGKTCLAKALYNDLFRKFDGACFLADVGETSKALEVLGSLLCGTTEDVWESTIKNLSRNPDKTINNVLKVSFDGLDENGKEIFLHIACFFKGWTSEYVKKVLNSCNHETIVGFDILVKRSLISIEYGILEMHDLIQAMGIDIVNQECRYDPGSRSRLWLYDDVVDVLSCDMENRNVKAIVLALPEPKEMCINPDAFTKLRRLKLLILHNVHDSFQGPRCLPNELKWSSKTI